MARLIFLETIERKVRAFLTNYIFVLVVERDNRFLLLIVQRRVGKVPQRRY